MELICTVVNMGPQVHKNILLEKQNWTLPIDLRQVVLPSDYLCTTLYDVALHMTALLVAMYSLSDILQPLPQNSLFETIKPFAPFTLKDFLEHSKSSDKTSV